MTHKPTKHNIAELLKPIRDQGWHWNAETGKLTPGHASILDDVPWITQNLDFDCFKWNRIFHHGVTSGKMVHTHCQTCFKVVVAPRTFRELLALEEFQESSGLRCKCGIELREYVGRPYGGYFYSWEPGELEQMGFDLGDGSLPVAYNIVDDTDALRKGLEKYKLICDAMDYIAIEDGPIPVILKRGCTEFEMHCGPTNHPNYRHVSEDQLEIEGLIDEHVDYREGMFVGTQPEVVKDSIRMRWAEFAHFIGDMTYVDWLGQKLGNDPVTYHKESK
jgi:hypothetical protein